MKKLSTTFATILVVLGCFAFSPASKAGPPIVGLWHVQLFIGCGTTPFAETYKQWHRDGLEFESANLAPGALCVGTWKQIANTVNLYQCRMDLRQPSWHRTLRGDRNRHRQPRRQ
jgi:hypothetical protein